MSEIRLLDDKTINRLAAGEVVERPYNVVKELVENSIDAGADNINIEIKDGGIKEILIVDNGKGIQKDDISQAFLRHATSKLTSYEDLENINSLGFRGEALAAISAVSKIELTTKTLDSDLGYKIKVIGGSCQELTEVVVDKGTAIKVENLFFNVPARRKFLRAPRAEAASIEEFVERLAVSRKDISFRFVSDGKEKFKCKAEKLLENRINNLFPDTEDNLIEIDFNLTIGRVHGLIGKPAISKPNRKYEMIFVNNRYIRDNQLSFAIEDAYSAFLMQRRFPFAIIFIECPSGSVDINIHPAKLEAHFEDLLLLKKELYESIRAIIKSADLTVELNKDSNIKNNIESKGVSLEYDSHIFQDDSRDMLSFQRLTEVNLTGLKNENQELKQVYNDIKLEPSLAGETKLDIYSSNTSTEPIYDREMFNNTNEEIINHREQSSDLRKDRINIDVNKDKIDGNIDNLDVFEPKIVAGESKDILHQLEISADNLEDIIIVGQIFNTYWILEYNNKMYLLDQHAAHEKIRFEKLMEEFNQKEINKQYIMPPIRLTLSPTEELLLSDNQDSFDKLGFSLKQYNDKIWELSSIPYNLYNIDGEQFFYDLLAALGDREDIRNSEVIKYNLATIACKGAIKGGMSLSSIEVKHLFKQLSEIESPYNCPHGRPTLIAIDRQDLEKWFKRIV